MKIKTILSCLFLLAFFTQNIHAQKEETSKRKMTIVTKTIDENGKETVTTVVKEGNEVSDEEIDKLIQKAGGEGHGLDVEVEVEDDKSETIIIKEDGGKEVKKQYKIIKKTQDVEMEHDGDEKDGHKKMIFISEDGDVQKMEGKEVKIIKKKDGDGEKEVKITVESGDDGEVIWIEKENGERQKIDEKDVTIIKKKGGSTEKEITVTVESGDEEENIWIEKMEGEEGDVITTEEETTETIDKNGNTIKKTVKKTKKVVKKGN